MQIDNNFFMGLALKEAWAYQGLTYPNPSVGCVAVKNNEILSIQAHKNCGAPHAEVMALQEAFVKLSGDSLILELEDSQKIHNFLIKNHNNLFKNVSLYTTLEPCTHIGKTPSCANLICSLGIKKVFIGAKDIHSKGGTQKLQDHNIEVEENILAKQSNDLLYPFLRWREDRFVLFKYASTLNGVVSGGYISNERSLNTVHKIRNKIDLLVIGGATVRKDRPTLDARLTNGKAPDILIYSKQKDFDQTIPLFDVPNRKVTISNDKSFINNYKYIMIEGVGSMIESFRDYIDYYLIFIAPSLQKNTNITSDLKLEILHTNSSTKDIVIWGK